MALIPLAIALFFSCSLLVFNIPLGRDFRGGTLIQVRGLETAPSVENIQLLASHLLGASVEVQLTEYGGTFGVDIEADNRDLSDGVREELENALANTLGISADKVGVYNMGSVLTEISKGQAKNAIIAASIAMAIIVFINFRRGVLVSSMLVSIGLDALDALGCMAIFGVPLSIASVAGFLMLIGYSVDTNVLLVTQVERGISGTPREQAASAMKTGLTMSITTLTVLIALNILTTSPTIAELTYVLIFGVIFDIINTWFFNASVVISRKKRREIPVAL